MATEPRFAAASLSPSKKPHDSSPASSVHRPPTDFSHRNPTQTQIQANQCEPAAVPELAAGRPRLRSVVVGALILETASEPAAVQQQAPPPKRVSFSSQLIPTNRTSPQRRFRGEILPQIHCCCFELRDPGPLPRCGEEGASSPLPFCSFSRESQAGGRHVDYSGLRHAVRLPNYRAE